MTDYKDILLEMGYSNIMDNGREFRMKPIYRDSSSNTVLSVRKDSGSFIDFSKNISGSFADLVKLSLNMKSPEEAHKWLFDSAGVTSNIEKPKPKIDEIKTLAQESDYFTRVIDEGDHIHLGSGGYSFSYFIATLMFF